MIGLKGQCKHRCLVCVAILFLVGSAGALAQEVATTDLSPRMQSIVKAHASIILEWANSPLLLNALQKQNEQGMSMGDVLTIDAQWSDDGYKPLVDALLANDVSQYLQQKVASSPLYMEAFLCDKKGAIVGLYPKTTDYWQGDEDKFIKSYVGGEGRIIYGPLRFDESTKTYSVQISVPVNEWNDTYGVLVVGIKNILE